MLLSLETEREESSLEQESCLEETTLEAQGRRE